MDKFFKKLQKETEWKKIVQEWTDVMEPATVETLIWNDQHRRLWTENKPAI
jgi:hypothetical protein